MAREPLSTLISQWELETEGWSICKSARSERPTLWAPAAKSTSRAGVPGILMISFSMGRREFDGRKTGCKVKKSYG
jgi:hypothetical protein